MTKHTDYLRKNPKQHRSAQKIEFIKEAMVRVLDAANPKYTTNHIAERAGVSVGTLYDYFPDKGALLRYVAKREITKTSTRVIQQIETSEATSAEQLVREVIDISLSAFDRRIRATHHLRKLAREDAVLTKEMHTIRRKIVRFLYQKLHDIDSSTFPHLSENALEVACDSFRDIAYAMEVESMSTAEILDKRTDLTIGILSALSSQARYRK